MALNKLPRSLSGAGRSQPSQLMTKRSPKESTRWRPSS